MSGFSDAEIIQIGFDLYVVALPHSCRIFNRLLSQSTKVCGLFTRRTRIHWTSEASTTWPLHLQYSFMTGFWRCLPRWVQSLPLVYYTFSDDEELTYPHRTQIECAWKNRKTLGECLHSDFMLICGWFISSVSCLFLLVRVCSCEYGTEPLMWLGQNRYISLGFGVITLTCKFVASQVIASCNLCCITNSVFLSTLDVRCKHPIRLDYRFPPHSRIYRCMSISSHGA